jgi:hypothetical protein
MWCLRGTLPIPEISFGRKQTSQFLGLTCSERKANIIAADKPQITKRTKKCFVSRNDSLC